LNSVDFPTFGKPTIPALSIAECSASVSSAIGRIRRGELASGKIERGVTLVQRMDVVVI